MKIESIILILLTILWIYLLTVLKRAKIHGLYFWTGSIGLFVIIACLLHNELSWLLSYFISLVIKDIGNITHWFTTIPNLNLIYLFTNNDMVQININYECSGMLEMLVYESLLVFYPIYTVMGKIFRTIEGFLWISAANILRIMLVIAGVNYFGSDSLFLMHSIISRILFYVLIIILYYNVFTKQQIIKGWRG